MIIISTLNLNNKEFTDPRQKAEILNSFFSKVFNDNYLVLPSMSPREFSDMPNIIMDSNGVAKLLEQFNPIEANGPTRIPTRVLKVHS